MEKEEDLELGKAGRQLMEVRGGRPRWPRAGRRFLVPSSRVHFRPRSGKDYNNSAQSILTLILIQTTSFVCRKRNRIAPLKE